MSHYIKAILAKDIVIQNLASSLPAAFVLSLPQGFSLIPLTDELYDYLSKNHSQEQEIEMDEFILLSPSIQFILKKHSQTGPIAYIETDYFGGEGTQSAILYKAGEVKEGPLQTKQIGAINQILGSLGVRRSATQDAFDTIGLGNFRSNDDMMR